MKIKKLIPFAILLLTLASCQIKVEESASVSNSDSQSVSTSNSVSESTSNSISESISSPISESISPDDSISSSDSTGGVKLDIPVIKEHTIPNNTTIDVYAVNDTHGAVEYSDDNQYPGIERISTYLKDKFNENPLGNVMLSSGDMFQGSVESNLTHGEIMMDWMKYLNFDSMTIGNHEFDWGHQQIFDCEQYAEEMDTYNNPFPFLGINIVDGDGNYLFDAAKTFERNGVYISIIGSIGSAVSSSIDTDKLGDWKFIDPTSLVIDAASKLRAAGSDIILYSTHSGSADGSIADYVDAVFTAHTHYLTKSTLSGNSKTVPLIQSGSNGKYVGHVEFTYSTSGDKFTVTSSENSGALYNMGLAPDQETTNIYQKCLSTTYSDGTLTNTIYNFKTAVLGSTPSYDRGTLTTNFAKVQLDAFINDGIVASFYNYARVAWASGDKTYSNIYEAFPFDNATQIVELSGSQLSFWLGSSGAYNAIKDGFSKSSIISSQTYKVVSSTYTTNNVFDNYCIGVSKSYDTVFQRHVLYNAFIAKGGNPF